MSISRDLGFQMLFKIAMLIKKNSNDNGMRGMKQLLTVTITGDGLEGKKAEGVLYMHDRSGRIFIVCFCRSVFLRLTDIIGYAHHTDWSNL